MTHKSFSILFFLLCSVNMGAQQTYDLPLAKPVTTDTEKVTGEGARKNITGVVKPLFRCSSLLPTKPTDVLSSFVLAVA